MQNELNKTGEKLHRNGLDHITESSKLRWPNVSLLLNLENFF